MVPEGYYYATPLVLAAVLIGWLASPLWAAPVVLLAAFCLWFFRDPERVVPQDAGAIVSPGDGKVTDVSNVIVNGSERKRISIFLNVFNVQFLNAMAPNSADENEQNIVTVEGEGQTVIFKQIAGLIARRIVFTKKVGDRAARGERVGMIKFGSRVDVVMDPSVEIAVKVGDHVKGAATVLAYARVTPELTSSRSGTSNTGAR